VHLFICKNQAQWKDHCFPCVIGKNGVTNHKEEGDMKTPLGTFALREVFYRADRVGDIQTSLKKTMITPDLGWCDSPTHPCYNKLIKRPFLDSHEELYREDHLYDIVVVVGYNDDPIIPGKGSAIFLHLLLEQSEGTAGCVAFHKEDLLKIIDQCFPTSCVIIQEEKASI